MHKGRRVGQRKGATRKDREPSTRPTRDVGNVERWGTSPTSALVGVQMTPKEKAQTAKEAEGPRGQEREKDIRTREKAKEERDQRRDVGNVAAHTSPVIARKMPAKQIGEVKSTPSAVSRRFKGRVTKAAERLHTRTEMRFLAPQ